MIIESLISKIEINTTVNNKQSEKWPDENSHKNDQTQNAEHSHTFTFPKSTTKVHNNTETSHVNKFNALSNLEEDLIINKNNDKLQSTSKVKHNENNQKKKTMKDKERKESRKKKAALVILGDSMLKHIQGYQLTKSLNKHNIIAKCYCYSGATTNGMTHHVIPTVEKNPESIVLHCGTNDLISDKSADEISNEIIELVRNIQTEENKIYVSAIIPRNDDLNDKGSKTNHYYRRNVTKETSVIYLMTTLIPRNILMRARYI